MNQFNSKNQRDLKVRKMMVDLLTKANKKEFQLDSSLLLKITQICSTTAWGFREILLVISIARLLDPAYSPTTSLYDCNPRALYEGPIRIELDKARIPHRKSGPLNVAKATEGINHAWAAQRRPKDIAEVTVDLAEWIENSDTEDLKNFTTALLAQLLIEAKRVTEYNIVVQAEADIAYLEYLCWQLIEKVPDAGNTPQRIVGLLLLAYHQQINSEATVEGYADRASTTNTTSKKPGDILEIDKLSNIITIYEVTAKPFDEQRMSDSVESILVYSKDNQIDIPEIIVLCRDSDVYPDAIRNISNSFHLATVLFKSITYQFLDIYQWITSAISRLAPKNRIQFYKDLNDYISDINSSEKVKAFWKGLHKNI